MMVPIPDPPRGPSTRLPKTPPRSVDGVAYFVVDQFLFRVDAAGLPEPVAQFRDADTAAAALTWFDAVSERLGSPGPGSPDR